MSDSVLRSLETAFKNSTSTTQTNEVGTDGGKAYATLAVLTLLLLLAAAIMIGHVLIRHHVDWISEPSGALVLGIVAGVVLNLAPFNFKYESLFDFNTQFFFIVLLPPIMFDAGYNLHIPSFFHNIGGILLLAFVGTITSTFVIALIMWAVGHAGISYKVSFFNSCMYGASISATDPVTVLATFHRLNANKDLHALVFGESVLNDAVAIVLYRVISGFQDKAFTFSAFGWGVLDFVKIFLGSLAIGLAFGFAAALLFRSQYFRSEEAPLEAALVIILAYCSFYLADGCELSGIVSIMVCAIIMAKYVRPNLMDSTDRTVHSWFRIFAWLSEMFVFIYIGVFLFAQKQAWGLGLTWGFIFFSLVALAVSRALNVYPNMALVNFSRPPEMQLPRTHQHMLWFSGLRGAMAFALAILGRDALQPEQAGEVILTATFFMVLITVMFNGGATGYLLERLDLKHAAPSSIPPVEFELPYKPAEGGPDDESMHAPDAVVSRTQNIKNKLHKFQRSGGIQERFKAVDNKLTSLLVAAPAVAVATEAPPRVNLPHSAVNVSEEAPAADPFMDIDMAPQ